MHETIESGPAASTFAQSSHGVPALWPGLLLAFAASCITIGIMWDISWHETIGRDTFWTPAHMAIYLGGALGGCVGGWLAVQYTFLASPMERAASVRVFGARAPLGAWVAIWGAIAMITSGPFDNWWHNAYGLDVKIISPPHALLGLGMFGIIFGALLLVLTRQNRLQDGAGSGLFIYVGGIFLVIAGVFMMEYTFPNMQHAAIFYQVCAVTFPFRLVALGRAGSYFLAGHPRCRSLYCHRMPDDLDSAALSGSTQAGSDFQSGHSHGSTSFPAPADFSGAGD